MSLHQTADATQRQYLEVTSEPDASDSFYVHPIDVDPKPELLHRRLGHTTHPVVAHMVREIAAAGFPDANTPPDDTCEIYMRAKQARPAFEENPESASEVLGIVHADVMGTISRTQYGEIAIFVGRIGRSFTICCVQVLSIES